MQHNFEIIYKTTVKVPIEIVWDAMTNPAIVKKYFLGTDLITNWEVGSELKFKGEWGGKPYEDKGVVQEYIHNKKLTYTYLSSWSDMEDKPENYLLVSYEVQPINGGTELTITQTNYDEDKAQHSEGNWHNLIGEMKKLIEIA